jgi:hypothetical protein
MWGGAYATTRESARGRARVLGRLFGFGVWAASSVELVPLGIYEPPWSYPLSSIADESATTSPTEPRSLPATGSCARTTAHNADGSS